MGGLGIPCEGPRLQCGRALFSRPHAVWVEENRFGCACAVSLDLATDSSTSYTGIFTR